MVIAILTKRFHDDDFWGLIIMLAQTSFVHGGMVYGQPVRRRGHRFLTNILPFALLFLYPADVDADFSSQSGFLPDESRMPLSWSSCSRLIYCKITSERVKQFSNGMLFYRSGYCLFTGDREFPYGQCEYDFCCCFCCVILWPDLIWKTGWCRVIVCHCSFCQPHFIILAPLFLLRKQYIVIVSCFCRG